MLLFMEGFDHHGSEAILSKKWTFTVGTSGTTTRTFTTGRYGGSCLKMTVTSAVNSSLLSFSANIVPSTTVIFAYAIRVSTLAAQVQLLDFFSAGTRQIAVYLTTGGTLLVYRGTTAGTLLGTSSAAIVVNTWTHLEFKITFNDTTGSISIRKNGVSILNVTGIDTNAATNISCDSFLFGYNLGGGAVTTTYTVEIDDVHCCDATGSNNNDFLGDCRVETLYPNAAGNYTQFNRVGTDSGANWSQVDDINPTEGADGVESNVLNNIDTYNYNNLSNIPITIFGIQTNCFIKKNETGNRTIAPVIRVSSTDYLLDDMGVGINYYYTSQIKELNPATVAAWTYATINGAEFGLKITA